MHDQATRRSRTARLSESTNFLALLRAASALESFVGFLADSSGGKGFFGFDILIFWLLRFFNPLQALDAVVSDYPVLRRAFTCLWMVPQLLLLVA